MDLFRKEVLNGYNTENGDEKGAAGLGIRVWLAAGAIALAAAIFAVWLIFATVYESVSVSGIVWSSQSGGAVYAERGATVTQTLVSQGQQVSAGDVLAYMPNYDLLSREGDIYNSYMKTSAIRSKTDGIVSYIVNDNTYVSEGDMIAEIVPYDKASNDRTLIIFIPVEAGDAVANGMEVQVVPSFVSKDEAGYIKGYISSVSSSPITGEYIKANYSLVFAAGIDANANYTAAEVTMMSDSEARSGLKWSSSASGSIDAPIGTVCSCDIITETLRPYQYLFR
ncbi:MAG: hypothetical protein LIO53_07890 [Oscillospiraceae bacterium]|nr:hypothetical protein [Oscillospiraceae bacterium]